MVASLLGGYLGCCWALMVLAVVGGAMNLLWMGGVMVLMIVEKLPDLGSRLTKPLGYALILAGGSRLRPPWAVIDGRRR
jgi:predicted metal-binding membrane protein